MSETSPAAVVILAAGEGKRMKSRTPKVLHTLCGRTLLGHALAAANELDPAQLVVVVGHGREQVGAEVASVTPQARIVRQDQQLGTGHAVRMVTEATGVIPGTVGTGQFHLRACPPVAARWRRAGILPVRSE